MSNGGVFRTALATPGILLNELITTVFVEHPLALPDLLTRWGSPLIADPSRCNSFNMKNLPVQQNCSKFLNQ